METSVLLETHHSANSLRHVLEIYFDVSQNSPKMFPFSPLYEKMEVTRATVFSRVKTIKPSSHV